MWAVNSLELGEDTGLQANLSCPVLNHLKTWFCWEPGSSHIDFKARWACVFLISPLGTTLNL